MRYCLFLATALTLCMCASSTPQEQSPKSMLFLENLNRVFEATVATVDSMGWEVLRSDKEQGTVEARVLNKKGGEFDVIITVTQQPTGMKKITLEPKTPGSAENFEVLKNKFAEEVEKQIKESRE